MRWQGIGVGQRLDSSLLQKRTTESPFYVGVRGEEVHHERPVMAVGRYSAGPKTVGAWCRACVVEGHEQSRETCLVRRMVQTDAHRFARLPSRIGCLQHGQ